MGSVLDDLSAIASRAEAWICILGRVISAAGFVMFAVGMFTSDRSGLGAFEIVGLVLFATGIALSQLALMVLRRRRGSSLPFVLHRSLGSGSRGGTFLDAVRFIREHRRERQSRG